MTGRPARRGPPPAVAAVRVAVRRALADLPPTAPILVAFSGGPDSLALLAGALFVRRGRVGAAIVDHGWSDDSARLASAAARTARGLGADPVEVVAVGPLPANERLARAARFRALAELADRLRTPAVLLGHTRDDQAETVLLGLARGSGARSLAGMPARRGPFRRPLLELPRAVTVEACRDAGATPLTDPANADLRHARNRIRHHALPALEADVGPGVAAALARSARLLRDDADLLDELAATAAAGLCAGEPAAGVDAGQLERLPAALRRRVLRTAAGARTAAQVDALDALVTAWHGQGAVALPGGIRAERTGGRIRLVPGPDESPASARTLVGPPPVPDEVHPDVSTVLIPAADIARRVGELAADIDRDYAGREVVLVGVLKGAIMVMADLSRALRTPVSLEFMAISSYGAATTTSGVVRILKDLDRDISNRHVLVVEDVIDSGLTLSWLLRNLRSRGPATLEVCALLRKPDALALGLPVRYVGFDIGPHFVVGYGLDAAERYRTLPYIGLLDDAG